jgi:hypothetical protein
MAEHLRRHDNGLLRWYRYLGNGEANPAPGTLNWHPNSGNPIGRGWDSFTSIVACSNGVVAGIHDNGNLYWYHYIGEGQSDWTGMTFWGPGSGTPIGNGWGEFKFVVPFFGTTATDVGLFAVTPSGDVLWYYFHQGWYPNSGNVIASGWTDVTHVTGAFTTIFAVADNGDLRWYEYRGRGESDPSGTAGWLPNSGNVIGNGWNGFRHLSCSMLDPSGVHELYASEPGGALRWYQYHGQGAPDPSGTAGWHFNSSNIISGTW